MGLKKEDLIGQYAPDVALKNDLMRTLLIEKTSKPLEIFANNKESYFEKEVLDIATPEKSVGKAILLRNITNFQERDLANNNFIVTVFHALKQSVLAMDKTIHLLETNDAETRSTEQRNHVENLKKENQSLLKIVGELLNMPKSV